MRGKAVAAYSLSLGLSYLGMGLLEALGSYLKMRLTFIPHDIFGGVVLLVIGGVYLSSMRPLWEGQHEGLAGLLVGTSLALIFGTLYLLVMGANWLSYLLGDLEEWRPLADFRPEIWLGPLALPGLRLIRMIKIGQGVARGE